MRSKSSLYMIALAISGTVMLAGVPASAQRGGGFGEGGAISGGGPGGGAPSAGVGGGRSMGGVQSGGPGGGMRSMGGPSGGSRDVGAGRGGGMRAMGGPSGGSRDVGAPRRGGAFVNRDRGGFVDRSDGRSRSFAGANAGRYHDGRHYGRPFRRGIGFAFGGYPYGYYDDIYSYSDDYYYPGYDEGEDSAAACAARFRSYDPASGTYLGYDGRRHPCP